MCERAKPLTATMSPDMLHVQRRARRAERGRGVGPCAGPGAARRPAYSRGSSSGEREPALARPRLTM